MEHIQWWAGSEFWLIFKAVTISLVSIAISVFVLFILRKRLKRFAVDRITGTVEFFSDPYNAKVIFIFIECLRSYIDRVKGGLRPFRVTDNRSKQIEHEIIIPYLRMLELFSVGVKDGIYDIDAFNSLYGNDFEFFEYDFLKEYIEELKELQPTAWNNYIDLYERMLKNRAHAS